MQKLLPVNDHVLVELPKDNSGVYIPQTLTDSTQEGIVIDPGEDAPGQLPKLVAGQKIRWEKFAEADGSFDYTATEGQPAVKAVLIKRKQIMGVYQ